MAGRVQILGLCRFSYVGGHGFQIEHASIEERRAFLYDPARLERRWTWFSEVALPGLSRQTDPDFTLVVMTGPDLPQPYLRRLLDLRADIRQLRVETVPVMPYHRPACWRAIAPHIDAEAEVVGHFRHDDDDAVAFDFVERARHDFPRVRPLWKRSDAVAIDYMRGVLLRATAEGVTAQRRMIYNASAGLVHYLAPQVEATAVHFPHWRLADHMPVVSLGEAVMFCRLLHGDNDSGDAGPGFPDEADPEGVPGLLRERFGIALPRLRAAARRLGGG